MQGNLYYNFLSEARIKEICKQCGLTFADDKILDLMFVFEIYYNGAPLEFERKREAMAKNNPRRAFIEEAYQILREEIVRAIAREIEKNGNKK